MPAPYLTVADFRSPAGAIVLPNPPTDTQITAAITLSQQLLERATRNWFGPQAAEFSFDGADSDIAFFEIPIISVAWLRLNGSPVDLPASAYAVYNGRGGADGRDDRYNPKIALARGVGQDIYTASSSIGAATFLKGRLNQRVNGVFGFTEANGATPAPILEAMRRMVVERLSSPPYGTGLAPSGTAGVSYGGVVIEEQTDGHRIKYADTSSRDLSTRRSGLTGISRDLYVLDVIRLYRAPIAIATPAQWSPGR